ncbi:MAG: PEGA domain-containing protein [Candidatus Aminicenantes bacterium]|nr:PEGA domain-containing protein [Candidatus Aminicenantes bacterium]
MKRRDSFLFSAMILSLIILSSCQTLSRKTVQDVPATSKPPGVNVLVDGKLAGKTPFILKLERKFPHSVRFEAEGFRPVEIQITRRRPPLGETILTNAVWAPVGAVVCALALAPLWDKVSPGEDDLTPLVYSYIIGLAVGWGTGVIVDRTSPRSFDLVPQTLSVEMEKVENTEAETRPAVIPMDAETFRQLRWIRVVSR